MASAFPCLASVWRRRDANHPLADALLARWRGCCPPAPKIVPARGREGSCAVLPACPLPRGKNRRGIEIRRKIGTRNREPERKGIWADEASHRRILGRRQLYASASLPSSRRRIRIPPAALRLHLPPIQPPARQIRPSLHVLLRLCASACLSLSLSVCPLPGLLFMLCLHIKQSTGLLLHFDLSISCSALALCLLAGSN